MNISSAPMLHLIHQQYHFKIFIYQNWDKGNAHMAPTSIYGTSPVSKNILPHQGPTCIYWGWIKHEWWGSGCNKCLWKGFSQQLTNQRLCLKAPSCGLRTSRGSIDQEIWWDKCLSETCKHRSLVCPDRQPGQPARSLIRGRTHRLMEESRLCT